MMKKHVSLLAAAALILGSTSAFAADWNFYGSARVSTFWTDSDLADQTNFDEALQANSRIGAKIKASDELSARFEYGTKDGEADVRYLYGEWNFGPGTLLVGKYETPLYMPVSNQVYNDDNGLEGWGEVNSGKLAQVRLKFGGFQIAVLDGNTNYLTAAGVVDTNVESKIPMVEASYTISFNDLTMGIGGGYNTFEYNNDEDIDSYVGMICATYRIAGFSIGAQGFMGQNVGNIMTADTTGDDLGRGYASVSNGQVIDNDAIGGEIVLGYTFNDMFGIEAGYGYTQTEYDNADEDEVMSYYLQAPITLATGVTIVPEVGMIDYQEDNQDEVTYIGAKWQINF